ncbi:MAG TPA: UDP-N-acetylmuramoyl-L-alanine--D-glutamate ligase [Candidatus Marinimicrobia bacterium]|nr:UDP-N-acetylmuramoyl-L-alanine--D-glutamate ligase [Candidatus Neomarinimicrobiota bacterium]
MINLNTLPISVTDKKVTVLGAKRSGLATAVLLARQGASVLLSDSGKVEIPDDIQVNLVKNNITTEIGYHSSAVLSSDLVVISPGIPKSASIVTALESKGIPIVSEIEMAFWFMPEAKLIAVTGSNGKTTTTTLIHELFKNTQYDVYCGGNIGISFSSLIPEARQIVAEPKVFVLEVSSFQLERIIHFHPNEAVILNVTDDHMDRYEHDINLYLQAKLNIIRNQNGNDRYIYFADDPLLQKNLPERPYKLPFGITKNPDMCFTADNKNIYDSNNQAFIKRKDIALLGEHNLLNILAALNAVSGYGIPPAHIKQVLKHFSGIEHRLEYVTTIDGIDYYNDSKATNVDSVKYALKSFNKPVIIILGGRDKDADFSTLLPLLKQHAKKAILIGEAAAKIGKIIKSEIDYTIADSMQDAVAEAKHIAQTGDVILLSPACASYDMFDNFEHRGKAFKEIVYSLSGIQ